MTQAVQIFNNPEFGNVRTLGEFNDPRFCLNDVCKPLDLQVAKVVQRLDDEVLSRHPIPDSMGRMQETYFVNEDGLYDVILDSRTPAAKKFRKWITSEVIPSIRRHGMYMTPEIATEIAQNPDLLLKVALLFKETKEKLAATEAKVVELQPKADYFDQVLNSKEALNVTAIAKIYGMTGVAFNKLLYEHKIQYPVGDMWVLFCEHMNKGYTVAVTDILKNGLVKTRTKWTHKGKLFIYNTLKNAGIVPEREREKVQMKLFDEVTA